ncbi:lysyl-tRNA synthetase, class 2 [Malonomonas rubra DSM 5091]|uniref:Lysyl-tRNA synthetase, class 2 n=1 Tax=Malonomonas rubra DSM 5091 TaxID=1122189 RepID=A0A1M6F018_MALRU|nr:EF-P lysine aminoacylase EpmA [Malonomonas rubra]SHI90991.1 lysyl-tRNA synthetase, class 2 [Malonomonas rubra DSM 5091]
MEPNWQLARKRPVLEKRARIVQAIRAFFIDQDFLEIETPQRIPANAPEFHIDAVPSGDWFLQTSPELAMKRLLAAGYGNIFQISHCWRDGERGSRHLPEYSMLEWYRPGCDYHRLMDDCEALLEALTDSNKLVYQDNEIDLSRPWPRLSVHQAFSLYADCTVEESLAAGRFDEVISLQIEPQLPADRPTLLTEYPASQASLARLKPENPTVAERFELYIAGMELANAFSELVDCKEQSERFSSEERLRRAAGKAGYPAATRFLNELPNMPQAAGIALGIDRLVMLLSGCNSIDEVIAFTPELL